jgi:hypothetical protein
VLSSIDSLVKIEDLKKSSKRVLLFRFFLFFSLSKAFALENRSICLLFPVFLLQKDPEKIVGLEPFVPRFLADEYRTSPVRRDAIKKS